MKPKCVYECLSGCIDGTDGAMLLLCKKQSTLQSESRLCLSVKLLKLDIDTAQNVQNACCLKIEIKNF